VSDISDRYHGWVTSHREQKLLLIWKLDLDEATATIIERDFQYRQNTVLAMTAVIKSLVKLYTITELDETNQKISKTMITSYLDNENLSKGNRGEQNSIVEIMVKKSA
jgi:hypothetical protein